MPIRVGLVYLHLVRRRSRVRGVVLARLDKSRQKPCVTQLSWQWLAYCTWDSHYDVYVSTK